MLPQILQQLSGTQSQIIPPQIKNIMQMIRSSGNPQAMLNNLAQNNPQMRQVMDIIKDSGGDPKRAFYSLAEKRGVNPEEILKQIR